MKIIKKVGILIVLLFVMPLLNAQDVDVNVVSPTEITAGEAVEIVVNIDKGGLHGFARLQQPFPAAISVKAIESEGADFSYSEGKLNIIWLNLPSKEKISLKYELVADSRVEGDFPMEGRFSYIVDGEREEMDLAPGNVHVKASPQTDPSGVVNIMAFSGEVLVLDKVEKLPVSAFRETPYISQASDGWLVNILVSPGHIEKLARVEETVPEGYYAEVEEAQGAIFSFKAGIAKFLWMTMPEEKNYFFISYKLKSEDGDLEEIPVLDGKFSYMENNEVEAVPVIQKEAAISEMNNEELVALIAGKGGVPVAAAPAVAESKPTVEKTPEPEPEPEVIAPVTKPAPPVKVDGIEFRVQVLAANKKINTAGHFAGKDIGLLKEEYHDGMYKYTSGSFTIYKEARTHLAELVREAGLEEAFVTAYNDGDRVSVDEALKLSGQKWFK